MLKKGLAWHYTAYDRRPELEKVRFQTFDNFCGLIVGTNLVLNGEFC